jgi:hypothetical protein
VNPESAGGAYRLDLYMAVLQFPEKGKEQEGGEEDEAKVHPLEHATLEELHEAEVRSFASLLRPPGDPL